MAELEKVLSRREFLRQGSILGGLALGHALTHHSDLIAVTSEQERILLQEALSNISIRPQYLNQLVESEFGEEAFTYFDEFIYDHDKSLIKKLRIIDADKYLSNPEDLEATIEVYLNEPQFRRLIDEDLEIKTDNLRNSPEGQLELKTYIQDRNKKMLEKIEESAAMVIHCSDKFGKGVRSQLYIFGDFFQKPMLYTEVEKPVFGEMTEELMRAWLQHEFLHAKDKFHGIDLDEDNSLDIDDYIYGFINPYIMDFIENTRGFIRQVEYSKEKFGTGHSAYTISVVEFASYLFINVINPETKPVIKQASKYELELLNRQTRKVDEAIKEHSELNRFLALFKKQGKLE